VIARDRLLALVLCVVSLGVLPNVASSITIDGSPVTSGLQSNLDRANQTFQRAIDRLSSDREAGTAFALESAALYRAIAREGQIQNHRLELNAGNAAMIGGDTGRAMLSFRRAEKIAPSNTAVRQSLAAARERVGTKVAPPPTAISFARAVDLLLTWRNVIPRSAMVWLAALAYIGAWGFAAVSILRLMPRARIFGILAGTVAILAACSLGADEWDRTRVPAAVIVQPGVVGLNGPASGVYEPTYKSPLAPGVECIVVEVRGAWSHVRLNDGGLTWVPSSSLEYV